jgi:hypothetical protein
LRASRSGALTLTVMVLAGAASLSAHRLDEYLQAARIGVAPNGVQIELDLTPGTAVATGVIQWIDRNRDGVLSSAEQRDYVDAVLDTLALTMDGRALHITPRASTFPTEDALERGEGTIRLEIGAGVPSLTAGPHRLVFRNAHAPGVSVYLANALVPESHRIAISAQRRDQAQRELTIDFALSGSSSPMTPGWTLSILCTAAVGSLMLALVWRRPSRTLWAPVRSTGRPAEG